MKHLRLHCKKEEMCIRDRYRPIFKEHRMCLRYLFEPNAGLGAAIHLGLQYVTGDYLCWSDPDDFYFPESMKKRWLAFQAHPECAVVSSDAFVFSSDDLHLSLIHIFHWYNASWMSTAKQLRNRVGRPFHRLFGKDYFRKAGD